VRSQNDKTEVKLKWNMNQEAWGFNIRYGTQADKLYFSYQVLGSDTLIIRSLNGLQKYYFTIDGFNDNGISKGTKIVEVN